MRLKESLRKILSVIATLALLTNSLVTPFVVYAQEEVTPTPDATMTPTEESVITPDPTTETSPTVEPTQEATITPEATIETSPTTESTQEPTNDQLVETQGTTSENTQPQAPPSEVATDTPSLEPTSTPNLPQETGSLSVTLVEDVDLSSILQAGTLVYDASGTPTVVTDKEDYAPTDVVLITGTGFKSSYTYTLEVISTDEPPVDTNNQVLTDSQGNFVYSYQLDGNYRPNYLVNVKDGELIIASTTFTDTVLSGNDIDIKMYGFVLSGAYSLVSNQPTGSGQIKNGNVGAYPEGGCIPFEMEVENKTNGAGDIVVSPVYDYLNSVIGIDRLENISTALVGNPRTTADNLNDFSYPTSPLATTTFATSAGGSVNAIVSGPYSGNNAGTSAVTAGDSFRHNNITLSNVPAHTSVYAILCGRLGVDASEYNGASMSFRTVQGGQENVPIPVNQLLVLPSLTLTKVVDNGSATPDQWSFNVSPSIAGQSVFSIPSGQSSVLIDNISPDGNYTITESGPAGYDFVSGSGTNCTFNGSTATGTVAAGKPPVDASCTFHNTLGNGTLTVQKTTIPAADSTVFTINTTGTGTITGGGAGTISDSTDQVYTATAGTYSVSETVPSGWSKTGDTCQNVVVAAGQNATCTITNTKLGKIIVEKQTLPDGSNQSFSFTSSYGQGFSLTDGQTNDSGFTLAPNTYSVSESVPSGWDQTSATCTDGSLVSAINLSAGETITCTFTNTQRGHIVVNKTTVGGDGNFDFSTTGTGYSGFSLSGGGSNNQEVLPGAYSVSEGSVVGWSSDGGSCNMGETPASLDVNPGETVTCTFTNTKLPKLTVVKNLVPSDDPGLFDLKIDDTTYKTDAGDEDSTGSHVVSLGVHAVSELAGTNTDLNDYNATYSGNCLNGSVDLEAGDDVTCTITNTRKTGNVVIDKIVSGGAALDSDWIFTIFGVLGEYSDGDSIPLNTGTYTISESNNIPGYTLTAVGGICNNQDGLSATLNVTEDGGTCTFTNTRDTGNLQILKLIDADGDPATTDDRTPAAGWVMDIDPDGQDTSDPSVPATDASGITLASGIKTGTYWVVEDPNGPTDNYHFLSSSCTLNNEPTGNSGSSSFGGVEVAKDQTTYCTFVNARDTGSIVVHKIIDADGDPNTTDDQTNGEDWEMDVDGTGLDTSNPNSQLTDVDGLTIFSSLKTGTYNVSETLEGGYGFLEAYCDGQDLSTGETTILDVEVSTGEPIQCTFVNFQLSAIGDFIWQDNNGDGVQDPGEPGISGVSANLYKDDGDGVFEPGTDDIFIGTDTTGVDGIYLFEELVFGDYWVDVDDSTVPAGYFTTTPDPYLVLDLDPGENFAMADFGYVPPQPEISIEKTNDKNNASAGDTVTYTLNVSNTGNVTIFNIDLIDILPGGFAYVLGSTTGATTSDPIIEGSKLTWSDVQDLGPDESLTLNYQVKIDSDLSDGTYINFATCKGQVGGFSNRLVALDVLSETIDCNEDDSSVTLGSGRSFGGNLIGQVLGASTELPATGSPTALLLVSLGLLGAGLILKGVSGKSVKRTSARKSAKRRVSKKRRHAKK